MPGILGRRRATTKQASHVETKGELTEETIFVVSILRFLASKTV
jgi:hypothetical protein